MRKILLLFLLFTPAIQLGMDFGSEHEQQTLLPHPPPYEETLVQSSSWRCTHIQRATTTAIVALLSTYSIVAQLIPADQIFTPESNIARHAWWGATVGSQVVICFIALVGIWRK